jgi:hypothetical protein
MDSVSLLAHSWLSYCSLTFALFFRSWGGRAFHTNLVLIGEKENAKRFRRRLATHHVRLVATHCLETDDDGKSGWEASGIDVDSSGRPNSENQLEQLMPAALEIYQKAVKQLRSLAMSGKA